MKRVKSYNQSSSILYLVATPIGNLSEISSRALDILKCVDVIGCEDTRTSSVLLKHFGIETKTIAYHNFNEEESAKGIIDLLKSGKQVALISDAGYPLVSDPGFELVRKCRENDIPVSTISGPSAGLNALVASGLDTNHYMFYGFLNAKSSKAKGELEALKDFPYTMIFYEAPHRINKTLEIVLNVLGDRRAVIARELTKLHEEYIEGSLSELVNLEDLKGEIVLLVEGKKQEDVVVDEEDIFKEIEELVKSGTKTKEACKIVALKYRLQSSELYNNLIKKK